MDQKLVADILQAEIQVGKKIKLNQDNLKKFSEFNPEQAFDQLKRSSVGSSNNSLAGSIPGITSKGVIDVERLVLLYKQQDESVTPIELQSIIARYSSSAEQGLDYDAFLKMVGQNLTDTKRKNPIFETNNLQNSKADKPLSERVMNALSSIFLLELDLLKFTEQYKVSLKNTFSYDPMNFFNSINFNNSATLNFEQLQQFFRRNGQEISREDYQVLIIRIKRSKQLNSNDYDQFISQQEFIQLTVPHLPYSSKVSAAALNASKASIQGQQVQQQQTSTQVKQNEKSVKFQLDGENNVNNNNNVITNSVTVKDQSGVLYIPPANTNIQQQQQLKQTSDPLFVNSSLNNNTSKNVLYGGQISTQNQNIQQVQYQQQFQQQQQQPQQQQQQFQQQKQQQQPPSQQVYIAPQTSVQNTAFFQQQQPQSMYALPQYVIIQDQQTLQQQQPQQPPQQTSNVFPQVVNENAANLNNSSRANLALEAMNDLLKRDNDRLKQENLELQQKVIEREQLEQRAKEKEQLRSEIILEQKQFLQQQQQQEQLQKQQQQQPQQQIVLLQKQQPQQVQVITVPQQQQPVIPVTTQSLVNKYLPIQPPQQNSVRLSEIRSSLTPVGLPQQQQPQPQQLLQPQVINQGTFVNPPPFVPGVISQFPGSTLPSAIKQSPVGPASPPSALANTLMFTPQNTHSQQIANQLAHSQYSPPNAPLPGYILEPNQVPSFLVGAQQFNNRAGLANQLSPYTQAHHYNATQAELREAIHNQFPTPQQQFVQQQQQQQQAQYPFIPREYAQPNSGFQYPQQYPY